MSSLFIALQRMLPQHGLSRLLGRLAEARAPSWLVNWVIGRFVAYYGVDLSEAERPFSAAYSSFNDFFTRALRAEARTLCSSGIASPADGVISQCGEIADDLILQAKGRHFTVAALLGADDAQVQRFRGGDFITIYLSPRDYHRVHMPLDGQLQATRYVPGDLFSVNRQTAEGVDRLFARNERLVCFFDTPRGPMAMVLIGAMVVAGIETVWEGLVTPPRRQLHDRDFSAAPPPVLLDRGAEMGRFLLGSTVILLLPPGVASWNAECTAGARLRLGQQLSP